MNAVELYRRNHGEMILPDNDKWQFRMFVKSETSGNKYIVSQNKKHKYWACDCPGWKRHRNCKHLRAMGLPSNEVPYEIEMKK